MNDVEDALSRVLGGSIQQDIDDLIALFNHFVRHDPRRDVDKEHLVIGRALLHAVRNLDIHVFVTPFAEVPDYYPFGMAHVIAVKGYVMSRHIEAFVDPDEEFFFHLLLHEWVHHAMHHTDVYTSQPSFQVEYNTEMTTLAIAHQIVSLPMYEKMTAWAKTNVCSHYARYADYGLTRHLSLHIADWCGYKTSKKTRQMLVEREAEWNRESTTSLTSNDKSQLPF